MGFRARYGERPLHLLAAIAMLAIAGYAFLEVFERPSAVGFVIWFAAAIAAHDLIAFPLYSLLNVVAGRAAGEREPGRPPGWLNYLRVPVFLSGLLFLVWFPLMLGLGSASYEAASGRADVPFLGRWLLVTAALFALSGLLYAISARRASRLPAA